MGVKAVSKAIAGMVASVAVAWVGHFTGFTIPGDVVDWGQALLATGIAAALGFGIVWISPPNRE